MYVFVLHNVHDGFCRYSARKVYVSLTLILFRANCVKCLISMFLPFKHWIYCRKADSLVRSIESHNFFLCLRNAFISRNLENTANARISSASVCRTDTLCSGESALQHSSSADIWTSCVTFITISFVMLMICVISSYQLGSGEAEILSRKSINDGRWHKITAVRYEDYILLPLGLMLQLRNY